MSRSSSIAFCYSAAGHGQTAMEMRLGSSSTVGETAKRGRNWPCQEDDDQCGWARNREAAWSKRPKGRCSRRRSLGAQFLEFSKNEMMKTAKMSCPESYWGYRQIYPDSHDSTLILVNAKVLSWCFAKALEEPGSSWKLSWLSPKFAETSG